MLFRILQKIDQYRPFQRASAHCDVPCGIYDPFGAQMAALTVIRCVNQLTELHAKGTLSLGDQANLARLVAVKEEHGVKVKEEIRIIWGDFIKQPQLEAHPELHELTHSIMLAGSKAKQHVDEALAVDLLEKVNRFAEIFWEIKGVKTYRAICPYAPSKEVVYPDLKG